MVAALSSGPASLPPSSDPHCTAASRDAAPARDLALRFPRWRWLRRPVPVVLAVFAAHVLWLVLMDRSLVCPCGVVTLWQTDADPAQNSQQFADFYSLLHVVYGMGLCALLGWLRPHWPVADRALLALVSSTLWEVIENTPWVIALLDNVANAAPDYDGDSILNSLADTGFAMAGFWLALRLPGRWILVLAIALEVTVTVAINDGLLLATGRVLLGLWPGAT